MILGYKKSKKHLIRVKARLVMENKFLVEGIRHYDQPKNFTTWKLGQTKPFFVSFSYRGERNIIGRSKMLELRLPDDPNPPVEKVLPP